MSASIALNLNTPASALTNSDALHDEADIKHSSATKHANQLSIPNSLNNSIYIKPPERESFQAKQDPIESTTPLKQQEASDGNFFSKIFSPITNLFSGKPSKNDDALTTDKALAIIKDKTVNHDKAVQALDYLSNEASACKDFFLSIPLCPSGFEAYRIAKFCGPLITDKGIDALLAFRKRIHYLAGLPSSQDSANRRLFINTLLNKIDNRVTQEVGKPIKAKLSLALRTSPPAEVKKIYVETMPQLKAIKAKMPPLTGPLTDDQIERKCAEFLVKTLGNICIEHDFKHQEIIEKEILVQPEVSIFINYIDKERKIIQEKKDDFDNVKADPYASYATFKFYQNKLASYPNTLQSEAIL